MPVEPATAFQRVDQTPILPRTQQRLAFGETDRLSLAVVVVQHQCGDILCHRLQQFIALFPGHVAGTNDFVEQDLDIDFVVGTVHTAGVIDKVGITATTVQGKFYPAQLGGAQIAALADHPAAQLPAIDPQRVVGFIADIGVGFL